MRRTLAHVVGIKIYRLLGLRLYAQLGYRINHLRINFVSGMGVLFPGFTDSSLFQNRLSERSRADDERTRSNAGRGAKDNPVEAAEIIGFATNSAVRAKRG
jgi:hypothetical protein